MPHTLVLLPRGPHERGRVLGELSFGLLVGIAGGWLAGLLRVRRP